ncbi:hypothetical protein [Pseudoflavonifractor sp. An85]|uniref:hypothetical protein n=1 Tax=Pseudoflavonifractor sp. An85 TaxID=1965661 RepID=UPI000B3AC0FC|nr:hypothetical protein [Pseudoflavonifractor sp. An85]OUN21601.1 hypothetical protein B5G37_10900 [Pseudoflavonifractor sp. An85]
MKGKHQKKAEEKLKLWHQRLAQSNAAYSAEYTRMDRRERIYNGDDQLRPLVPGDTRRDGSPRKTSHVRNIVFENIETQVSSAIPQPKVTPRRREDEGLAQRLEHFLRNELERLPFAQLNDLAERTVPIQGGVAFLVEWDNRTRTHDTVGTEVVRMLHPKQLAPQPGVFTSIQDMDWIIVKIPTTQDAIYREYGIWVEEDGESEPAVRGVDGVNPAEDALTRYVGYEKNAQGGVNRYCWVNDTPLEDLEDYQARRQPVCKQCGRVQPLPGQLIQQPTAPTQPNWEEQMRGEMAGQQLAQALAQEAMAGGGGLGSIPVEPDPMQAPREYQGGPCPWCGCEEFEDQVQEYEQVLLPVVTGKGMEIPGATPDLDGEGNPVLRPTLIPFYQPGVFPVVLQRSVSVYGQLLGNSDVDMIADQQNTINRMEQKIIDRLVKAGTRITLPDNASLRVDSQDGERWYIGSAADKAMIGVYDFKGDLEYELLYLSNVYEEARQILGITDSYQGRSDSTATSGKAKEFSAAQAAGRLESKRVMKHAAYADLFRMMFQFWLAYGDEPRPITYRDTQGHMQYELFNRYDFLERDEDGQYYWNDQFLFSVDTTDTLATNREAMWQETRQNLQTGAFGDPAATETLILFWTKMEQLHYPGAGETKQALEQRLQRESQQQALTQGNREKMPIQMGEEGMR